MSCKAESNACVVIEMVETKGEYRESAPEGDVKTHMAVGD